MAYIHNTTKEQKTYKELQALFPRSSLPVDKTNIIGTDWYYINPVVPPEHDEYTEVAVEQLPAMNGNSYNEVWTIAPLAAETLDSNQTDALEFAKSQASGLVADLIAEAHMNPSIGVTGTVERHMAQLASRANKYINGIDKSDEDKVRDNAFYDYQDSLIDAEDGVFRAIASLPAKDLYALEIDKVIAWPVWSPPV